jgi:hypothetical protein
MLSSLQLNAQGIKYLGIVQDEKTKEPLAFVNIISSDGHYGTTSDIDGKFKIVLPVSADSLRFSYLGYETSYVLTQDLKGPKTVYLKARNYDLAEYEVFPGINPAHRIILNAVKNRDLNNPQKLKSYSYTTYDKMVVTIDSVSIKSDTAIVLADSSKDIRNFFKKKDLFIMETSVEKKFLAPDKSNERIIATKVSGLKDPMIIYLVSQIQSTSFYDEIIQIANKNYINPISKGSLKKYYFQLEDTIYSGQNDTVFTISYRPLLNSLFDGMQGVINISTNKWAIANVIAKPAKDDKGISVHIQQKYELIDGKQWFPVQLNTNIIFDVLKVSTGSQQTRLVGVGKTYISNIELNPEITKKAFSHIEIELDPNAGKRNESQWLNYRVDSISARDLATYHFMDSIGQEAELDKRLNELETALTGKISWGKFDLLLDKFTGYNSFEGFWFGMGIQSNKRFSEKITFGVYYGYSLKDKQSKLGLNTSVLLYKPNEIKAHFGYIADNEAAGNVEFYKDTQSALDPRSFQNFLVNNMNFTVRKEAGISGRIFKYFNIYGGFRTEKVEFSDHYIFQKPENSPISNDFRSSELKFQLRYAYNEKYFDNGRLLISLGTNYPVFWLTVTQGLNSVLGGDFNFTKLDFQISKSFYTKYLGETNLKLRTGIVFGDVPYSKLYLQNGTFGSFTVYAPESFGTMHFNEFLSDSYIALFLSHNFGSLLFKGEKFKPEFELISNLAFGKLKHPEYHQNIAFKTMEKGYFESGIMVNNILRLKVFNVGFGALYRYGPYHFEQLKNNMAYKFTITFPFKSNLGKVESL